jgi:hypothetical protein
MENIIELINNDKFEEVYKILKKEHKLNDFIIDKSNILHLCAIRGKEYIYELIKDKIIDIYLSNGRGENILHLLLRNGWDKIALKIVNIYPDLLNYQNMINMYPIMYAVERKNILKGIINIILKHKDFIEQINVVTQENKNLITRLIDIDNLEIIERLIKHINFNIPKNMPILMYAILNKKTKIVNKLIEINPQNCINIHNELNMFPIHTALTIQSYEITKKLLESKDFDMKNLEHGISINNLYLPLNMALDIINYKGPEKNYLKIVELIFNNLKNYKSIDKFKNTYAHYAANIKMKYEIMQKNITILDKIIDKIDKKTKNIDNISIQEILNNKLENKDNSKKCILSTKNKIEFPETKHKSNTGLFNSDIIHNMIYFIYILKTHNNVCMPMIKSSKEKEKIKNDIIKKLEFQNIPYDVYYIGLRELLNIGYQTFYELMPSLIIWKDKDLYWFDPNFEECIKSCVKSNKRFIMIKVSYLYRPNSLHANVIIYDKEDASYRRFEPYGNSSTYDEMYLDKLVMDYILKYKNTKIKYYTPGDFLETGRFQSISNDSSLEVKKTGDPFGYCLAWCMWYIEIKLKNTKLTEQELIEQAAEKIYISYCKSDTPYMDFIRDYSRKLNDEKDKMFKKFGINKKDYYNISYNISDLDKISEGIIKEITSIITSI